jgi:hypothetical protein
VTSLLAVFFWFGDPLAGRGEPESLDSAPHNQQVFLASPLAGWNRDEMPVPGPNGASTILKDTGAEYGLFLLYANPRLAVNNTVFHTEENGAKVAGDIFFLNLYGASDAILTWNLGGGYTWHSISVSGQDMTIGVPVAKAGIMIRWPSAHLSFKPYLAPARENINTPQGDTSTDCLLYGLTAKWQWRMLQATGMYYYEDDLHSSEHFNNYQARLSAFASRHWGLLARFDRTENAYSTDTSFTFGPVYVF